MRIQNLKTLGFALILLGCNNPQESSENVKSDDELMQHARDLSQKYIITDGHVDLPYRMRVNRFRLQKEWIDVSQRTNEGDFDYPRAKEGGLDAPFMSIYVPSEMQISGGAKDLADSLIGMVEKIPQKYPDKFAMAYSPDEVNANFEKGLISLPLGMENGAPIEDDLSNVKYFHERGIRYITLTHATDNLICDSSYDTTRTHGGLSQFGRDVVMEMNRVGIMVDISHVSDDTFYQVLEITKAPVIASHSSCRAFTPGFVRNMSDDMIKLLPKNGGVIQINFGSSFLDGELVEQNDANRVKLAALLEENGLTENDPGAEEIIIRFRDENPILFSDVERVADHIDHVIKLAGIDHVAFGSDYDGVGDSLPVGLKDVSNYPNLIFELLKRGYSDEDIAKICYQNVWRVWSQVAEASNQSQS